MNGSVLETKLRTTSIKMYSNKAYAKADYKTEYIPVAEVGLQIQIDEIIMNLFRSFSIVTRTFILFCFGKLGQFSHCKTRRLLI